MAMMRKKLFKLIAWGFRRSIAAASVFTRWNRKVDLAAATLAGATVVFYRRYLSPSKSFCCAHARLTGMASCSAVSLEILQTQPLSVASSEIRAQFERCKEAAFELKRRRASGVNADNQSRLTSAKAISGVGVSGLLLMDDRNRERLKEYGGQALEELVDQASDNYDSCSSDDESKSDGCDVGDGDLDCGDCSS